MRYFVDGPHYYGAGNGAFKPLAHVYDPNNRSHKPVVRRLVSLPTRDYIDIVTLIREACDDVNVEGMDGWPVCCNGNEEGLHNTDTHY